MSYMIIIECDNPSCDKRLTVPQAGAMPPDWLAVRQAVQQPGKVATGTPEVITKTYCSAPCLVQDFSNGH